MMEENHAKYLSLSIVECMGITLRLENNPKMKDLFVF
jgi:hypothetical protein